MSAADPQTDPTYSLALRPGAPPPLETEWLLANGTGAYAMGSPVGCNTRRYHGLLIAAARPPVERINTLNCVGETIRFDGQWRALDTHEFAAAANTVFHPDGWRYLVRFEKDREVRWCYRVGSIGLVKTLRLVWKRQLAVLRYDVCFDPQPGEPALDRLTLEVRPFIALRDFHGLCRAYQHHPTIVERHGPRLTFATAEAPDLHIAADRGRYVHEEDWWHNFFYRRDAARHQAADESLFTPGRFEHTFDPQHDAPLTLAFGLEEIDWHRIGVDDGLPAHRRQIAHAVREQSGERALVAAAIATDDFVVDRTVDGRPSTTIIAGYPWFSDWGRDTMIALPGCLLCTKRFDEARQTLGTFARHIRNGLVPNRFDDYGGDPHYNTVDASLWFVHAAIEYVRLSGDRQAWDDLLADACMQVIEAYARGTDFHIAMDDDGLIAAGDARTQLTWMDAARDGVVFTPRHGKAVEINALWHNAVAGCAQWLEGEAASRCERLARRVRRAFGRTFWDEPLGHCLDHVHAGGADRSLRPNQILAASLARAPLSLARRRTLMHQ
ncbi:MAG: hypothetical protein GVY28_08250, partial [Alphaproteobacteria bacterium]|nr:hypothetical protein [Alphaproteobacteria bacterium]